MRFRQFRELLGDVLNILAGVVLCVVFGMLASGARKVVVWEPSAWVAWAEFVVALLWLLLGVERLVGDVVRWRRGRRG